ncbi:MAG: ferrous iron transport protein B [Acidithiobacillus sp.]|uniref:ferrous iron transport protein B n=1 Tax=Acidithiobacillus sp. TaxID=1872118 RepID=UPI003D08A3E4
MKKIAILGMPNTGKSTFFNRLTGSIAKVGNWPGITVDLLSAKILLGGDMVEVVDLPGIYNLHGFSDDEQVVRQFLEEQPVNALAVIANPTQLDRQLALVLQLRSLGLPMILLLNMSDEARRLGVHIDVPGLARALRMPVVELSAKYGQGFPQARHQMEQLLRQQGTARAAQTGLLQEDDALGREINMLLRQHVTIPVQLKAGWSERIDKLLLHPWLGLPLFFLAMLLLFEAVYGVGTPLQDGLGWTLDTAKTAWLIPALAGFPPLLQDFLLSGIYDGVGTVLTFLPIILVFFVGMSVVEDSGYLARAAFLMDALMSRLGLDGRAFVMQLMGFGCNVPAIMGTRILRSRSARLLSMLIIPFSLCSARLQVFLFFTSILFSPRTAPLVLFSLYVMSLLAALLTALVWKRRFSSYEPMLLEMPPYRFPTLRQMLSQGWQQSRHFLAGASGFIVLGVVAVWALTHFPASVTPAGPDTLAGILASWLEPVFQPLGIDKLLSIALLFGFVAKEIVIGALAVIFGSSNEALGGIISARMDWVQAYSFMLFTLIYTPCLATVAALQRESRSWGFTSFSLLWSLGLAWITSFLFYQGARALGL